MYSLTDFIDYAVIDHAVHLLTYSFMNLGGMSFCPTLQTLVKSNTPLAFCSMSLWLPSVAISRVRAIPSD